MENKVLKKRLNFNSDDEMQVFSNVFKKALSLLKISKKLIFLAFFAAVLTILINYGVISFCYNVYLNGTYVGKVKNIDNFNLALNSAYDESAAKPEKTVKLYPAFSLGKSFREEKEIKEYIVKNCRGFEKKAEPVIEEKKEDDGFAAPVYASISSNYGERWGKVHKGIDFAANYGDEILSAKEGVVKFCGFEETFGNLVIIEHGEGYQSYYAHMSKILVAQGDSVSKGQKIGEVGSTGNSTGPHLHFEIRLNGEAVNPAGFISF